MLLIVNCDNKASAGTQQYGRELGAYPFLPTVELPRWLQRRAFSAAHGVRQPSSNV
jgi:hypothetical protein